jgi:hypothetical protein
LNHANHYQSKDLVFRVRCNDLIRFENCNIENDGSEMIKVTDTLITFKKLRNKCVVAVIFTISRIKHLQTICDLIRPGDLSECELTGTILKFEKKNDDNLFYSGCFSETITCKGNNCLLLNCTIELIDSESVTVFKISRIIYIYFVLLRFNMVY